jgi:hypothetical protein
MEKNLLHNDKGVSLMIGYVLLIVIAVSISVGVFFYLKLYLPSEQQQCPKDVSLVIDSVSCENDVVLISLTNRGLFSLDGVQIRIGDASRLVKTFLNEENGFIFFGDSDLELIPGEDWNSPGYNYQGSGIQEIEVEPTMAIENKIVLCNNAVASKIVDCGP